MVSLEKLISLMVEHKDYSQLYSALISLGAFLFSVFSFGVSTVISVCNARKNKKIADQRYEEQRRQYEERLFEERKHREEDIRINEERIRILEEPCLIFKESEYVADLTGNKNILLIVFVNKGRGAAYETIPELRIKAMKSDLSEFLISRYMPVRDPIVLVEETFETLWYYPDNVGEMTIVTPVISYEDASGRQYKQSFCINITGASGEGTLIDYTRAKLII